MLKRDNWTNEEVIRILEGLKLVDNDGNKLDMDWNTALDTATSRFWDFIRPEDQYAAMAYDTEDKMIYVVGPPLPQ